MSKETWVYLGERSTGKGERYYAYVDVSRRKNDGSPLQWAASDERWFSKKLVPGQPGRLLTVTPEYDEDGTHVTEREPAGMWANREQVVEWKASSDAIRDARKAAADAKREADRNYLAEALEPVRQAYLTASWQEQQQILAAVIRYVTRGT